MEWVENLNESINYIEEHLHEKIDYNQVAKKACCSLTKFQRLFLFATDVTVSEYVRCRRMTLAARELINSDIKIINLATMYGYESSESFTRAFHTFHGMPPATVRKLGIYNELERISINLKVQGGNIIMGRKPIVRIEEFSGIKAATFRVDGIDPEDKAFSMLREWAIGALSDYAARRCIGYAPMGHHSEGEDCDSHEYVAQMFLYEHEIDENGRFHGVEVDNAPQGLYIVGDVVLNEFHDDGSIDIGQSMKKSSKEIYDCLIEMKTYELDMENRPFIEEQIFQPGWFAGNGSSEFKLWLPIRIKQ